MPKQVQVIGTSISVEQVGQSFACDLISAYTIFPLRHISFINLFDRRNGWIGTVSRQIKQGNSNENLTFLLLCTVEICRQFTKKQKRGHISKNLIHVRRITAYSEEGRFKK